MAAWAAMDAASCEWVVAPAKPTMEVPGEVPTSPSTVTMPLDVAVVLASTAKEAAAPSEGEAAEVKDTSSSTTCSSARLIVIS